MKDYLLLGNFNMNLTQDEIKSTLAKDLSTTYYDGIDIKLVKYWNNIFKDAFILFAYSNYSNEGVGQVLSFIMEKNSEYYYFKEEHCSCNGFSKEKIEDLETIDIDFLKSGKYPYKTLFTFSGYSNVEIEKYIELSTFFFSEYLNENLIIKFSNFSYLKRM